MVVLITVVKMHKKYILYLIFVEADIGVAILHDNMRVIVGASLR